MDITHNHFQIIVSLLVVGLLIFLCFFGAFVFRMIAKRRIGGLLKSGLAVSLFILASTFGYLAILDWSIPDCYDDQGVLLSDNPECQFP